MSFKFVLQIIIRCIHEIQIEQIDNHITCSNILNAQSTSWQHCQKTDLSFFNDCHKHTSG